MKLRNLLFLTIALNLLSLASAEQTSLGNIKIGDDVPLIQLCADCSYNNITYIIAPNGSSILGETAMSGSGSVYTYTLTTASEFGEYRVNGIGDLNGTNTVWSYSFFITPNGEELKGENFMIFLYLAFFLVLFGSLYFMIINIAKLASTSETVFGLATSWSIYFALILCYWLVINYSTSSFLRTNIIWPVSIFGFSNFLLPLISLFVAIFKRSIDKKAPLSVAELTGRRMLGYE